VQGGEKKKKGSRKSKVVLDQKRAFFSIVERGSRGGGEKSSRSLTEKKRDFAKRKLRGRGIISEGAPEDTNRSISAKGKGGESPFRKREKKKKKGFARAFGR